MYKCFLKLKRAILKVDVFFFKLIIIKLERKLESSLKHILLATKMLAIVLTHRVIFLLKSSIISLRRQVTSIFSFIKKTLLTKILGQFIYERRFYSNVY